MKTILLTSLVGTGFAFTAPSSVKTLKTALGAASITDSPPIYDPLNLYPANSPERKEGRIQPLERTFIEAKPVLDPMNLYSANVPVDVGIEMSQALPFLPRPEVLEHELAGDVGFDPFNLAPTKQQLAVMRIAELKHSRIAMLATVGWMSSELLHNKLAQAWGLTSLLGSGDRVPSVLNGGLDKVAPGFWVAVLIAVSALEMVSMVQPAKIWDGVNNAQANQQLELAEIKHGRLAMMAITGFAIQEFFTGTGVIHHLADLLPQV